MVDSLRVMKQQFNYFIRRVSFAAPLGYRSPLPGRSDYLIHTDETLLAS